MITGARWVTSSRGATVFALAILIAVAGVLATQSQTSAADPAGIYVAADSLVAGRSDHTATLLDDGTVFIAGGLDSGTPLGSTEIYDPATDSTTAGPTLSEPRTAHRATLLADGRVLITGGFTTGFVVVASVDLYDPGLGTITPMAALSEPRASHTATLLPSGEVLVAGGFSTGGPTDTAELFDAGMGTWTATGSLAESREAASADLLGDGTVLIAAGQGTFPDVRSSAEIYDPATGMFSSTGSLTVGRWWHTHSLLPDGSVLFAGGNTDFTTGDATDSVESYDPASGTFTTLGTLDVARVSHSASPLPDGTLLIVGGGSATPERWDPETDGFEPGGAPVLGTRSEHTATVLRDSRVFIAGGGTPLSAAELYVPDGIIVEGGSAMVPDFATLGTSVTEVFDATAGDISLATDLYTFAAAASSLPFASPSVSVSLTPLADLSAFAGAAPLPDGASFLGAVALDVFVSGLASGPFAGPATIAVVPPAGVAPGEIVAYGFIPLLITSQIPGTPASNWARLTLAGLEGSDTFNVSGPGIIAFGLGQDPAHAGIPGLNGGVVIVFDPVQPGAPFTLTDMSGAYRIHGPADLFAGEQPDTVVARLTVHDTGPGFAGPDGRVPIQLVALSLQSVRPVDLGVTGEFYLDDFQSFRTLSVSEGTASEVGSSQLGGGLIWTVLDPSVVEIDEEAGSVRFPMGGGGLFAIIDLDADASVPLTLATTASANFVLWTAGETSASTAFSGDAVQVVWRWNGAIWESFNPNVPPILSTDFALGAGPGPDVLWLVTSGPLTVEAPAGGPPTPAGPNLILATGESADFVVWRGGETTAAALFRDAEAVVIVWRWTGETWVAFNPALPPALQTDFALGAGEEPDLLWLVTTGAVEVPLNPQ